MKRIYVGLLVILLASLSVSARHITPDEAMTAASDFLSTSELRSASATSDLRPMKAPGVGIDAVESPYYIFNRGANDGFVIISGDDRTPKILGYSDKGSFDANNLPPQLKAMMEQWATQMSKLPESARQHASWSRAAKTRSGEEVLLETANWGQGFPYNASCPIVEGANCVTGCVATAMAIVMKYHNWPETYDWSSMPMNTEKDPLDYEVVNPALSGLMADAGEAVYMEYSPFESGAAMNWVGHRLQYLFHYSPECQFISSENFPKEKWEAMIKDNIDNHSPIIYSGNGTGAHAFVLDGYNDIGYHINWGWDGLYNGYFVIDDLTPNEFQSFSNYTGMVMNILPDQSGYIYSECFVDNGYFFGGRGGLIDPLNISVENVVKGEAFHIANEVTTFPKEFNGAFGIALVNENNEIKEVLQIDDIPDFVDNGFPYRGHTINFTNLVVTKDIDPTDRLQLITKKRGEDSYRLVLGTIEHQSYIGVVNNTPDLIDLNISIGPGVNFSYNIYGKSYSDYISLEEGYHEVKNVPKGLFLDMFSGPKIEEKDRTLIVNLKGDYIYGSSQNFRVDYDPYPIGFGTTLYSSYEINARLYDLLDVNINVEKSGTLKEKLSEIEKNSIRELTISGTLNAVDLWYIRDNCPSLEYLDIKNVIIEGVVAEDSKMTQFDRHPDNEANTIPEFGLASLKSLRTLLLPESITGICNYGLCDLSLQSITIPSGVTNIGLNGLWANEKLNSVELQNPEPIFINDCVLSGTLCPEDGILYVPEGTLDKYNNTPIWQDFKEIREEKMPVFVNSIKIFPSYCDAFVGDCFQVETTVFPKNAMDKTIIWSSSDPSIASVDPEGNITVNDIGNVDIFATAADGSETSAVCHVTATEHPKVEFIELSIVTWNGFEGETFKIEAIVYPEIAFDKTLVWSSSDESVATVDSEGNVTVHSAGEAVITVTAADGSGISSSCTVMVAPRLIPVESVTLSQESAELKVGENLSLTATVLPEDATDKTITWSSDNEAVAILDGNGNVTAVSLGTATITATSGNISATCVVTVVATLVDRIILSPDNWSGVEGESFRIEATVLPEDATDKALAWTSSDESVATVNNEGNVSVLSEGTCVITASATDGSGIIAECIITGKSGVSGLFSGEVIDVYDFNGVLIKKDADVESLKQLTSGIYLIRQGTEMKKLIIR